MQNDAKYLKNDKPWQVHTHPIILSKSYPMNTNMTGLRWFSIASLLFGDKVAQLVRCQTSNQRVAGSIPGYPGHFGLFLGKAVYSILLQSTQLQNGYLA